MKVWAAPFSTPPLFGALGAIALGACLALPARATSMPERTAAEVAAESELVVEATALSSRTAWVGGRIVTFTELRIERALRARDELVPAAVTVALPGGELDGIGQRVAGAPRLLVGGRYLLCLSAEVLGGARTVVGLWQGAWRVDGAGALVPFTHQGPAPTATPRAALERVLLGPP